MTDYEITDLSPIANADVVPAVILPVVDPNDISTPPADADGSNKRMTIGQLIPTIYMPEATGTASIDTATIQAVINASSPGDVIAFRAGSTAYEVNAPIVYLGDRKYVGMGVAKSSFGATIRQADGANIGAGLTGGAFQALFAADVWANGSGGTLFCDDPVIVSNLCFDVNAAGNPTSVCAAIAMVNFWSMVADNQIQNTTSHGLVLTDTTFAGTVITNGASQNRIYRNDIMTIAGDGIRQICANNISNLDGFCADNDISACAGDGINYDSAAGWKFQGNHLYAIAADAISLSACFATWVVTNYIEDFGSSPASGQFYSGISVGQLDGRGSFVTGNFVSCAESSALVGAYQYIAVASGFDETDAQVCVVGNQVHGPASPTTQGIGLVYQIGGGTSALTISSADNLVVGVDTPSFVSGGVTLGSDAANPPFLPGGTTMTGYLAPAVFTLTDGSSVAVDAALGNVARWPLAGSGHTLATPSSPVDGQALDIRIIYSGAHTPLFSAAWDFTPIGGAPTWTATSGKVDEVGFRYNADAAGGSGAWVCVGSILGA